MGVLLYPKDEYTGGDRVPYDDPKPAIWSIGKKRKLNLKTVMSQLAHINYVFNTELAGKLMMILFYGPPLTTIEEVKNSDKWVDRELGTVWNIIQKILKDENPNNYRQINMECGKFECFATTVKGNTESLLRWIFEFEEIDIACKMIDEFVNNYKKDLQFLQNCYFDRLSNSVQGV